MSSITDGERINMSNMKKTINTEAFIIPNHSPSYLSTSVLDRLQKIVKNNNLKIYNDIPVIQIWMVSEEVGSDNISDHGFCFTDGEKKYRVLPGAISEFIPAEIFIGKKEGESVTINFNDIKAYSEDEEVRLDLVFNVKLNQRAYRYRNFGTFEEVFEHVTR